jgi:site-specific DNA-cytosine methylase
MGAGNPDVSGTLGARGTSGGQTTDVDRAGAYVVDTLRSHPRPGSNSDGALVLAFNWQTGGSKDWFGLKEGETDALSKNQTPAVYVAAPLTRGSATGEGVSVPGRRQEDDHNLALALDVRNMKAEDVAKTLLGGEHQSYSLNNMSVIVRGVDELSGPLTKRYAKGVNTTMDDGAMAIVENQRAEVWEKPYAQQVTTGGGKVGQGYNAARIGTEVRRLTPTECERLQGFPDGWTLDYGPSLAMMPSWYELPFTLLASPSEPAPDGRRYAAMGDAVTVPVAEWIGKRILALEGAA